MQPNNNNNYPYRRGLFNDSNAILDSAIIEN